MAVNSVRLNVRKTFEFILKDGQVVELEQDEAEQVRDYLNTEIPKVNGINTESYQKEISSSSYSEKLALNTFSSQPKLRPVPTGYFSIGKRPSEPRNGAPSHLYKYYKDPNGNYGFQIENDATHSFNRLGKIIDADSTIGKILRTIPSNQYIIKNEFQKLRICGNTQTIKAALDILEIEGYVEKALPIDGRNGVQYRRITKLERPEVGNNHDPVKV